MKGGSRKTRRTREPKKTPEDKGTSDCVSSQSAKSEDDLSGGSRKTRRTREPKKTPEDKGTSDCVSSQSAKSEDDLSGGSRKTRRTREPKKTPEDKGTSDCVSSQSAKSEDDLSGGSRKTRRTREPKKTPEDKGTSDRVSSQSAKSEDDLSGGSRKTRRAREPKKTPKDKGTSDSVSSQAIEESNAVPVSDAAVVSQSTATFLQSTPKRGRRRTRQTQEAILTSTPVHSPSSNILSDISESPRRAKRVELEYTELITQLKTSELDSPKPQSRRLRAHASQTKQVRQRVTKEKTETCSKTNSPPAKRRRGRPRKVKEVDLQLHTTTQSSERARPRFELEKADTTQQEDEPLLSPDLSIELSHHEEELPSLSFQEDEGSEEEEEEELPSFLMQVDKKPTSITEGVFVWHKFRNYPFWPALVKSVNRKQKKASIIFIDDTVIHTKKGFTVALRTLKPFDCEEARELVFKAKEEYDAAIEWSLDLIADYGIRIGCGSFSGSFIEYFAHDMSYPVRRKYPQAASERLTIASDSMVQAPCDDLKEDSFSEQHEEVSRSSQRLLPDRSHAAHNRANEKLVHFIVKQRMVEGHLLAVISGQQESRWLRSFLSSRRRRVVNIYLEDDQQLDQVYVYLSELYSTVKAPAPCLPKMTSMERVAFVLDVLLPEAIIYAIAGVDNVPVKKAEEKYLKGRCISNRERQEFDVMIERHMKNKITASEHVTVVSDPAS